MGMPLYSMNTLTIYHLTPKRGSGFHFGEQGLDQETSHVTFSSDSLFAALIATLAENEGPAAVAPFIEPFRSGRPPFKITSLFPRVGHLPLFPLPLLSIHTRQQREQAAGQRDPREEPLLKRKFARKTNFVSWEILRLLTQAADMDSYLNESDQGAFMQEGAVWLTRDELRQLSTGLQKERQIWQQGPIQHVTLDRLTNAGTPFITGRVSFAADCGLWLGVQFEDANAQTPLELLLHHLGDRGLGGERGRGYGGFDLTMGHPLTIPAPSAETNGRYLLSRYYPQPEEIAALTASSAAYQLVTVGGWFQFPGYPALRRKKVTLVEAASILAAEPEVQGAIPDVKPDPLTDKDGRPICYSDTTEQIKLADDHHIYRYGLPLTLPTVQAPLGDASPSRRTTDDHQNDL